MVFNQPSCVKYVANRTQILKKKIENEMEEWESQFSCNNLIDSFRRIWDQGSKRFLG